MKQHQHIEKNGTCFPDSAEDEIQRGVMSGRLDVVEDLLERYPIAAENVEQALDLVYAEIAARDEARQMPVVEDYTLRFPQWAARIERLFEVHVAFRESVATIDTEPSVPDSTFPGDDGSAAAAGNIPLLNDPRTVGQYELLEEIGSGATGIVFRAQQAGLRRMVAVKILRPFGTDEARERFRAEAALTARLQHPNIVRLYEVGCDAGCDFMSMEILEGGSLATTLGQTAFSPRAAAELVRTLAGAVAAAHDQGIVHRDLKPGNVLMARDGSLRISDFGLARHLSEASVRQTRTGAILGTPGYMAPEQANGSPNAGPPADIYSVGAILYELLTGRPPYHGTSVVEILEQMHVTDPPDVRHLRPGVPRDLQTICMKCLERAPEDRYASAAELHDDLNRYLESLPILARPASLLERFGRWTMRRKWIATLSLLLLLTTLSGTVGIVWQWLRAEDGLISARIAAKMAESAGREEQRQRVISEGRLYRQQILAADREFQSGAMDVGSRILQECDPAYRGWEWELLHANANSASVVLDGQPPKLVRVDVSPNGRLIAALCGSYGDNSNRQVMVSDFETRQPKWNYAVDRMGLSMTFSPDSRWLLVCGHGTATLHDAETGHLVKRFPVQNRISNWGAAFGPDGQRVAVPDGHTAKIFTVDPDDELFVTCQGLEKSGGAYELSFHPDGRVLAIASRHLGVTIHDCTNGALLEQLPVGSDTRSVEFSPDGSLLAAAGHAVEWQGILKVWHCLESGFEPLHTRYNASGMSTGFRFSPDGQVLAMWTGTSPVQLMHPRTLREVAAYPVHAFTRQVAFGPGSRLLVTCGIESLIRIHDRAGKSRTPLLMSDPADATDFAVHPTGRFVALISDLAPNRRGTKIGNAVEIMDLDGWKRVYKLTGHTSTVTCVAYDSSGSLLASGSDDRTVRLWTELGQLRSVIDSHKSSVVGVHFLPSKHVRSSAEHEQLVSVDQDGHVMLHDTRTSETTDEFGTGVSDVRHSARHENRLALATGDGNAVIVNLKNGKLIHVGSFDAGLNCIAFNPEGDHVCICGDDGTVRLLSLTAGSIATEVWRQTIDEGAAYSVAFDPTGTRIVTCGEHGLIRIHRADSGVDLLTLKTPSFPGPTFRAQFDPQGRRLLATAHWMLYEFDSQPRPVISEITVPNDPVQRESIREWHVQQAFECQTDGNWLGAVRHWRRVGELNEHDALVHVYEARCHQKLENWMMAETCYRSGLLVGDAHAGDSGYDLFRFRTNCELSRFLVECPDLSRRSPLEAINLAVRALIINTRSRTGWKTLGAAVAELLRGNRPK